MSTFFFSFVWFMVRNQVAIDVLFRDVSIFPYTGLQVESSFLADHVHAIQRSTVLSVFLTSDVIVTVFIFGTDSSPSLGL